MKEFIEDLSNKQKIKRKDLLEKDVLIHKILLDLCEDKSFFQKIYMKKNLLWRSYCFGGKVFFYEKFEINMY